VPQCLAPMFSSFSLALLLPLASLLFPYTTLFRSLDHRSATYFMEHFEFFGLHSCAFAGRQNNRSRLHIQPPVYDYSNYILLAGRSEEHTSELQSRFDLVCRLLLERKKCTDQ